MRISDWSSDVCSSDLVVVVDLIRFDGFEAQRVGIDAFHAIQITFDQNGIASTQLLGDLGEAAFFYGDGRAVWNRYRRAIAVDQNFLTFVAHGGLPYSVWAMSRALTDRKSTRLNSSH